MTEENDYANDLKTLRHLFWIIGLIIIVLTLCLTLIWINAHSWTIRFEMDNNTLEAVKSINWSAMSNEIDSNEPIWFSDMNNKTLKKHIASNLTNIPLENFCADRVSGIRYTSKNGTELYLNCTSKQIDLAFNRSQVIV